jgi:predicted nucleic acid-binding Zn ribbon protein
VTEAFPKVLDAIQRSNGGGRKLRRKPRFDTATLPPDHPFLEVGIPIPNGRHCLDCGKELLRMQRRYCDGDCQSQYHEAQRLKAGQLPVVPWEKSPDGKCVKCGAPLTGKQSRFCGKRCSGAFLQAEMRRRARQAGTEVPDDHDPDARVPLPITMPLDVAASANGNGAHPLADAEDVVEDVEDAPQAVPSWLTDLLSAGDEMMITKDGWRLTVRRA